MKKVFLSIFLIVLGILFSSCSLGGNNMFGGILDNDQKVANEYFDEFIEALESKNKDAIKTMFSKNSIKNSENFEVSIDYLFDYFQGEVISYNDWAGPVVETSKENDHIKKIMDSTYDVETNGQQYRFAIQNHTVDTANPDNVGIWSLYIIKLNDDTDPQYAYRGDDKNTPGINIGIKNIIPDQSD